MTDGRRRFSSQSLDAAKKDRQGSGQREILVTKKARVLQRTGLFPGLAVQAPGVSALNEAGLLHSGRDEAGEQRVRIKRLGFQLRVELHAHEPGMIRPLHDFRQHAIG